MSSPLSLNQEGEEAWLRLKQHLQWSEEFSLGFIFSSHPEVITIFRQRLAEIYRARISRLHIPVPEKPELLLQNLLPALLHPTNQQQALQAPYWLDLSQYHTPEWTKARLAFMARLNEQRESLRHALTRPIVLILPLSERTEFKALVPDLWAIRNFSLVTDNWLDTKAIFVDIKASPPPPLPHLSSYETSMINEWQRLLAKQSSHQDLLLAGQRAWQASFQAKDYHLAKTIGTELLDISRKIIKRIGETPESLRDCSVSLDNMGNTAKALGDLQGAQEPYRESLDISRKIIKRIGETPESLRDCSVSLNNVGNTAKALGDLQGAQEFYRESLDISRKIIERIGETPESLRDLSVSLNNVGNTAKALGDLQGAQESYRESLDISRKIIERIGETPESLRDLSVSLNKAGNTAKALGDLQGAQEFYRESLDISRKIIERIGETPESLRDLSVSLDKVGDAARTLGGLQRAQKFYRESLDIRRKIIERIGETPESLRDLSVSLNNVGNTAKALSNEKRALKYYKEGLQTAATLNKAFPHHTDGNDLIEHFQQLIGNIAE